MNENEKNLTTEETEENDYIQAINELKANTVDKSQYEKLKAENKKLLDSLVSGQTPEIAKPVEKPDINELRKKIFNLDNNPSNIEYIKTLLELRNALIENEKQNINTLKQEQSALIAERDKAVADGKITKYSEEWYNMCQEIDGVTQAIEEGTTALIEYNNALRDIDWQKFDLIQERISDVTAESEFLIELMSNKDLFDDNGKLTEQGAATMGLHALNYNTAMYQADDYGKEIATLDKQIAKDTS